MPKLLEDVPLAVRARMWYVHDGAPTHFSRAVRDVLNNTDHDQWKGRGEPIAWSPPSPDLNPQDFYLWRHLKSLVYVAPVDNEEALHHCIVDASQTIRNYLCIFEQMQRSMMRRVEACTRSRGGHSEHILRVAAGKNSICPKILFWEKRKNLLSCYLCKKTAWVTNNSNMKLHTQDL
jgi:hypothetical protein